MNDLSIDELAEAQAAVQINISWCKGAGFQKSQWGRERIKSLDALNSKLDHIINAHCGHEYSEDEPDCGCGTKRLALVATTP